MFLLFFTTSGFMGFQATAIITTVEKTCLFSE